MTYGKKESHFNLRSRRRVIIRVSVNLLEGAERSKLCFYPTIQLGIFFRSMGKIYHHPYWTFGYPNIWSRPDNHSSSFTSEAELRNFPGRFSFFTACFCLPVS